MDKNTSQLSQLINQEFILASRLLELMLEEKSVLEESSPHKLSSITERKALCLDQIESVSKSRTRLLLALAQGKTNGERLSKFLDTQTTEIKSAISGKMEQLEETLENCSRLNSVNGMIIAMSQRNVQRNINIIKGVDHDSMTYTPQGHTSNLNQNYGRVKA